MLFRSGINQPGFCYCDVGSDAVAEFTYSSAHICQRLPQGLEMLRKDAWLKNESRKLKGLFQPQSATNMLRTRRKKEATGGHGSPHSPWNCHPLMSTCLSIRYPAVTEW